MPWRIGPSHVGTRVLMTAESFRKSRAPLVLLLLGAYLLLAFAWQDLPLWDFDDAMYLASGSHLHASMFLNDLTSMPLYALWFKVLAAVCNDAVWRQFLSWALLVVIVGVLPVLAEIPFAWLYTAVLIALPFFVIQPYVSLFAAMFFVAGMVLLLRKQMSFAEAAVVACGACFLVAYSRPEFQYGVFFSMLAVVIAVVVEGKGETKQHVLRVLLPTLILAGAMVYVVAHSDAGRSGVAFAQHFNVRAAGKGLIPQQGAWDSTYAYRVFGIDVAAHGGRHSIGEFFRANPLMFLKHVLLNVFSPGTVVFLVLSLSVILWPWFHAEKRSLRPASLFLLLISLPTYVSLFLVFPDKHYMSIVFPATLLLGLQWVGAERARKVEAARWVPVVALLLMGVGCLRGTVLVKGPRFRPGLRTIGCLRGVEDLRGAGNAVVYDPVGVKDVYLRSPKMLVHPDGGGWPAFEAWAKKARPDWILITPEMEAQFGVSGEAFDAFAVSELGYRAHACGASTELTVYVSPER